MLYVVGVTTLPQHTASEKVMLTMYSFQDYDEKSIGVGTITYEKSIGVGTPTITYLRKV